MNLNKNIFQIIGWLLLFISFLSCSKSEILPNNLAIQFDGDNSYISIKDDKEFNPNKISFGGWFRFDRLNKEKNKAILSKADGAGYNLWINLDRYPNSVAVHIYADTLQSARFPIRLINENEWVHLMATYDEKYIRLYLNGILQDTAQLKGSVKKSEGIPFVIGAEPSLKNSVVEYNNSFTGAVKRIEIWNRALTSGEIKENMLRQLDSDKNGLVGCFRVNKINAHEE